MKRSRNILLILLTLLLCLTMLVTGCGGADKTPDDNNTPSGNDQPVDPPSDPDPQVDTYNLYRAASIEEIGDMFSIFTVAWDDNDGVSLINEGTDEYGDKMTFFNSVTDETVTMWFQDGIITKVEPEDWVGYLLNTDGNRIFFLLIEPMFIFNDFYEYSLDHPQEYVEIQAGGTENRNLVHMTLPVKQYTVKMLNPANGELLSKLDYWIGSVAGYDIIVEWQIENAGEVMQYRLTELRLAN